MLRKIRETPARAGSDHGVRRVLLPLLISCVVVLSGCETVAARNSTAGITATVALAHLPTSQVQQVYYLGVFDPRDQLPPTIYRVRVRGQASALNQTKFASGWVHSSLVDSLSSSGTYNASVGELAGKLNGNGSDRGLLTGRRLLMFGPEGFREAPKDHRLVIVMGSDPQAFFGAVDSALGTVAEVTQGITIGPEVTKALLTEVGRLRSMGKRLAEVSTALDGDDAGAAK